MPKAFIFSVRRFPFSFFFNKAKQGEAVKATLNPEWDTMVELLVADYTQVCVRNDKLSLAIYNRVNYLLFFSQTTLSFVVLDKETPTIKVIKDDRGHFMGSCNLSLTEVRESKEKGH